MVVLLVIGFNVLQDTTDRIFQNVGQALASNNGAAGDEPTARPGRTASPTPLATQAPSTTFDPIALSGTGNGVPRFTIPESAIAIADVTHRGAANFVVWTVGADGQEQELLVNVIGDHAGTVLFDTSLHSVAFSVEADGAWAITVKPVGQAFTWDQTDNVTGAGDDVLILDPASGGLTTVQISHRGSSNFAIWAYGDTTDLLVNEIGDYTGESLLPGGTILLQITADGNWSISPPS